VAWNAELPQRLAGTKSQENPKGRRKQGGQALERRTPDKGRLNLKKESAWWESGKSGRTRGVKTRIGKGENLSLEVEKKLGKNLVFLRESLIDGAGTGLKNNDACRMEIRGKKRVGS